MKEVGSCLRVTLVVLLCTTLGACESATEAPEVTATAIRVRVAPVQRGAISDVLTVTGETAALSVVRLAAPVVGRITMLTARPGDHLAKDEVAARVLSFENEAALRGFAFLAGRTPLSPEDRRLAQRLQQEVGARAIPLRAPFAAVVAERSKNPDEVVAQGDVVLELFDPGSLYVLAQVPVESAARVHSGQPVQVTIGHTITQGEVSALVSTLVPQSLTVPVRIVLAAPVQPALLHAAASCRITLAHAADALLIPRSALVSMGTAGQGTVMIAAGERAQRRRVELGMRTPTLVEVRAGLGAGELVLTEGQYALPDGTRIAPMPDADQP
jgi:hypothetical protein